jgi:hypothetical protein
MRMEASRVRQQPLRLLTCLMVPTDVMYSSLLRTWMMILISRWNGMSPTCITLSPGPELSWSALSSLSHSTGQPAGPTMVVSSTFNCSFHLWTTSITVSTWNGKIGIKFDSIHPPWSFKIYQELLTSLSSCFYPRYISSQTSVLFLTSLTLTFNILSFRSEQISQVWDTIGQEELCL